MFPGSSVRGGRVCEQLEGPSAGTCERTLGGRSPMATRGEEVWWEPVRLTDTPRKEQAQAQAGPSL